MAALTQLAPYAGPGGRYGSFAGKEAGAEPAGPHNPGHITTLWPYGGPGHLYGSFAGKQASDEPEPPPVVETRGGGWIQPYLPGERRRRGLEWDKPDPERLRKLLQQAYAAVTGEGADTATEHEAAAIVEPFADDDGSGDAPPASAIDWAALARDVSEARRLLRLYEDMLEEEEAVVQLLLLN